MNEFLLQMFYRATGVNPSVSPKANNGIGKS